MAKLIKICSHPRSGTHLLANFLAENFYEHEDLTLKNVHWGHWANRKIKPQVVAGKLIGTHQFPSIRDYFSRIPKIYIYRDGRAVAYSLWKSDNFINPNLKGISFSDFLRDKLDWKGSPAYRSKPKETVANHWYRHVVSWKRAAQLNRAILVVRYESLLADPEHVYKEIANRFSFLVEKKDIKGNIQFPNKLVGISPNSGKIDKWKTVFSDADKEYFLKSIPLKYQFLLT